MQASVSPFRAADHSSMFRLLIFALLDEKIIEKIEAPQHPTSSSTVSMARCEYFFAVSEGACEEALVSGGEVAAGGGALEGSQNVGL